MNRHLVFISTAVIVLALAAGDTRAQELQLKEADIRKLIPLLRAQAAGFGAAQAMSDRQEAARTSFSGDPLEFFRSRAKVDIPQGARYVAGCSRAASIQTSRGPLAIFTFGRNIDCYNRTQRDHWRSVKRGPDEKLPPEPKISQDCYIEREQAEKFLDDVAKALQKSGLEAHPDGFGKIRELASGGGILEITLWPYNIYDRANLLDDHPLMVIDNEGAREAAFAACSDMPSGPIMVVLASGRFFEKEPLDGLDAALRKAGLSEEEFEAFKMALFLARMDTKPEWFQAAEAAAGNDPAALRDLATRRANAELYRRLAAELDPLLDALVPKQ